MTGKPHEAKISTLEPKRDAQPHAPALADPRTLIIDPASANIVYFDDVPVHAVCFGVASVTLTAQRHLTDAYGQVREDRIITGLLRAPLPAMLRLRTAIDEIVRLAQRQAEASAAMADTSAGLPN